MDAMRKMMDSLLGKDAGSESFFEDGVRYREYLAFNTPTEEELFAQREADTKGKPFFTLHILGDVGAERTLASLSKQTYRKFEVTEPGRGTGDYVMHLDGGDTLAPDALFQFAAAGEGNDLLYCDEDRMGKEGRTEPLLKCQLSEAGETGFDMLGHGTAVSRALYGAVGGFSERYDYNLRCVGKCETPKHIARVLYTCAHFEESPHALESLERHIGLRGYVMRGMYGFRVDARVKKHQVGIIVANHDGVDALRLLLESIEEKTFYEHCKIAVADLGSRDPRMMKYYDILEKYRAAKVIRGNGMPLPMLLNQAAREMRCDVLVFLGQGCKVITHRWITDLLAQLMRDGVGAVGPKIQDEGGRLIHCGTVVGIGGWEGSPYAGEPNSRGDNEKNRFVMGLRPVSALSAKCMMVRADAFFYAGGFGEDFEAAGMDTEFCLRLMKRGLDCLYVPHVLLSCGEKLPRIGDSSKENRARCYDVMRQMLLEGDPYYNPNYDYASSRPMVAITPRPAIEINELYGKKS